MRTPYIFADLLAEIDRFLDRQDVATDPVAMAERFLSHGETVLQTWLITKGQTPTDERTEDFRLLALHRQGARGDASFNACRETCRELVYLWNVIALPDSDAAQMHHHLRLQAMVLRHLALFVGGKLVEEHLGEFCCSSRPLRTAAATDTLSTARAAGQ